MELVGKNDLDGLAIICGYGDLPRVIAEMYKAEGRAYRVVQFEDISLTWADSHPVIPAILEQAGKLFSDLQQAGCTRVVIAGAMQRGHIDPAKLDGKGYDLAEILGNTAKSGDDSTLSAIIAFFEANGFDVIAAHQIVPKLIPPAGVLTDAKPTQRDSADVTRATEIVNGLGALDVGQGAVVGQGLCLGLESIQGTDAMLSFVQETRANYAPNPDGGRGVLFKAPKPSQDLRVDMPTIGPETIRNAFEAGLSGVAIEAGGVIVLNLDESIAQANNYGLFLWVRPKE